MPIGAVILKSQLDLKLACLLALLDFKPFVQRKGVHTTLRPEPMMLIAHKMNINYLI